MVEGGGKISRDLADASLTRLGVDRLGLDGADRRYLTLIAESYGGGPVGIETLSAALSESRDALEEVIEPFLLQQGLIQRTPRGRMLAAAAWRHLGIAPPSRDSDAPDLFEGGHMRLAEFEPLTEAEQAVIAGLGTGHVTVLGDGTLPGETAGEDRQVRASLIRWLALGAPGDDKRAPAREGPAHRGRAGGQRREVDPFLGDGSTPGLDLEGCTLAHDLALVRCRFQHAPLLRGARVQSLILNGAALPGLRPTGWRRGATCSCAVSMRPARCGCSVRGSAAIWTAIGGRFENAGGKALSADRLEVRGTFCSCAVSTRPARCGCSARGSAAIWTARAGGSRTRLKGGAQRRGARVTGTLFWRRGATPRARST